MRQDIVIGIIGGQGWMGRALGLALLEQGIVSADRLVVSSRSGSSNAYRDWRGVRCVKNNRELVGLVDGVKHQQTPAVTPKTTIVYAHIFIFIFHLLLKDAPPSYSCTCSGFIYICIPAINRIAN